MSYRILGIILIPLAICSGFGLGQNFPNSSTRHEIEVLSFHRGAQWVISYAVSKRLIAPPKEPVHEVKNCLIIQVLEVQAAAVQLDTGGTVQDCTIIMRGDSHPGVGYWPEYYRNIGFKEPKK